MNSWILLATTVVGAACFHVAYTTGPVAAMVFYLASVALITFAQTARRAFWWGLLSGLLAFVPQLLFFFTLFGVFAVALYPILAFWVGLFAVLGQQVRARWGRIPATLALPVLWTGIEFFRSELYYLRFSWLNVGFAWPTADAFPNSWILSGVGVYGVGFLIMVGVGLALLPRRIGMAATLLTSLVALIGFGELPSWDHRRYASTRVPPVGSPLCWGVQLEFPSDRELKEALDRVWANSSHGAELVVLSEYTFDGPPPPWIREWCRQNSKYLIAGGKQPLADGGFANTAFVMDYDGEIVFQQGKSVPVQFFSDGEPAEEQRVWDSPWGKIGICVCYDLSYSRVVDELVQQGARAIIVPTMDLVEWGAHQHRLHARVGPVRSREHGIPVFRVCSSGVSQMIQNGEVVASAPFPGRGQTLSGWLAPSLEPCELPLDRTLAPVCSLLSGVLLLVLATMGWRQRQAGKRAGGPF